MIGDVAPMVEPSPIKRASRPSYSMVEAALSGSESSENGDGMQVSGSEDELAIAVATYKSRLSRESKVAAPPSVIQRPPSRLQPSQDQPSE